MRNETFEIDDGAGYIGFREALDIIEAGVKTCGIETLPLDRCVNRVAAEDLTARTGNPDADVALKERRQLILVPREAPYSSIHLEHMLKLSNLGVSRYVGDRRGATVSRLGCEFVIGITEVTFMYQQVDAPRLDGG